MENATLVFITGINYYPDDISLSQGTAGARSSTETKRSSPTFSSLAAPEVVIRTT